MDEKNNMPTQNENSGFVMVEPEQSNSTDSQAQSQQQHYQTETQQPQPEQTQSQQTQSQQAQSQQAQSQQAQSQPRPQPMPSQDNVYRYQNVSQQQSAPQKVKKEKKGLTIPRVLISAVIFGVVAAVCFVGVQQLSNLLFGEGKISFVQPANTGKDNQIAVTNVSGSAVAVNDVSGIVERVMPSIVSITEKSTQTSYFGQTYSSQGAGSGFIVKQDNDQLLIVTNNHVVDGADKITVTFNDNEMADATVKGTSQSNDLAVLSVDLKKLKESTKKSIRVASLGSSDNAKVGEMVIAIGNALGYGQSVTVGYLSAKDREVTASDGNGKTTTQMLLQTDAAINPGNSGGALIDKNGNVIGINSSKRFAYNSETVEGMGYAIPMSRAVSIINDLMEREVLKDEEKGYLGITGSNITESVSKSYGIPVGVYVRAVSETGAASKAGIKQGDVITKIDDTEVKTIDEVKEKVNSTKMGTKVKVTLMRKDNGDYKEKQIEVTLKGQDTIDDLPDDSTTNGSGSDGGQGYGNGGSGSQVIPWGSGIY